MERSTAQLYGLALLLLAIATTVFCTVQLNGIDFWLQAKVGELIAIHHVIPETLLFPFTEVASDTFHAHEWLASLLFHYELQWLGEDYMPLLIGLHGALLFLLAAILGYLKSNGSPFHALIAGFVTVLMENYRHVMRPELPAILVMMCFWIALEHFHQRPRWLPAIVAPLLMVAWTNMHGSFVLGVVLAGAFGSNALWRFIRRHARAPQELHDFLRWVALGAVIILATLLNPEGIHLWTFVLDFGTNSANRVLTEWYPTLDKRMHMLPGLWIALTGWLATIALCIWQWKRLTLIEVLLVAVFSVLFFRAIRFPVFFALVSGYVFASLFPAHQAFRERSWAMACVVASGLLCVAALLFGRVSRPEASGTFDHYRFSPLLVKKLADPSMQGNVFNQMEQGAELIYRAYPRLKPMVDCRFDSYSQEYLDYLEALRRDDKLFDEFVARYDVRYLMMDSDGYQQFQSLPRATSGRWAHDFNDQYIIILKRVDH